MSGSTSADPLRTAEFARLAPREQDLARYLHRNGKTSQLERLLRGKSSTPRIPQQRRPALRPVITNDSPPVANVTVRNRGRRDLTKPIAKESIENENYTAEKSTSVEVKSMTKSQDQAAPLGPAKIPSNQAIDSWLASKAQNRKVEVAALAFAAECSRQRCAELEVKLQKSRHELSEYKSRSTAAAQHLAERLESAFARAIKAEAALNALQHSRTQSTDLLPDDHTQTQTAAEKPAPPPPPPIEVTPRKSKKDLSKADDAPLRRSSRLTAKKLQRTGEEDDT